MRNGTMNLNGEAAVMEGARQDVMELEAKRRIREGAGFIKTYPAITIYVSLSRRSNISNRNIREQVRLSVQ